jgi:hypothetical protein
MVQTPAHLCDLLLQELPVCQVALTALLSSHLLTLLELCKVGLVQDRGTGAGTSSGLCRK